MAARNPANAIVNAALGGFSSLIGLQFVVRIMTYIGNLYVTRALGPAIFGLATVQMELVLHTSYFLSKEAFRRACIRSALTPTTANGPPQVRIASLAQMLNVAWLAVISTFALASLAYYFALRDGPVGIAVAAGVTVDTYQTVVLMYVLSVAVEVLSEPLSLLSQNLLATGHNTAEAAAVLARCVTTIALAYAGWGLMAVGVAQISYGLAMSLVLLAYTARRIGTVGYAVQSWTELLPRPFNKNLLPVDNDAQAAAAPAGGAPAPGAPRNLVFVGMNDLIFLDGYLMRTLGSVIVMSLIGYVLAEGERLALTLWVPHDAVEKGAFGLVNSLGSIVARFLFRPVEFTCLAMFSKLLARLPNQTVAERAECVTTAARMYRLFFQLVLFVGIIFICFGPSYSYFLIHRVYGAAFSGTIAPMLLGRYCFYVLLLGVNGINDAFLHASATPAQLYWYQGNLIFSAALFVGVSVSGSMATGVLGVLYANYASMLSRIVYSFIYILRFFAAEQRPNDPNSFSLQNLLPSPATLAACMGAAVVTRFSGSMLGADSFAHVGVGAVCGLAVLGMAYLKDRGTLREINNMRRAHRD